MRKLRLVACKESNEEFRREIDWHEDQKLLVFTPANREQSNRIRDQLETLIPSNAFAVILPQGCELKVYDITDEEAPDSSNPYGGCMGDAIDENEDALRQVRNERIDKFVNESKAS